jgi:alkylhydroperoxidase family enzyme
MDRIRPLARDEAAPDAQAIYDRDEAAFGLVLNPTRVMAHRPPILAASKQLGRAVSTDAVLPADLRALVCVRVATLVGCPF